MKTMNEYGVSSMPGRLRHNTFLFNLYQAYMILVFFPLLGIGWIVLFGSFLILLELGARRDELMGRAREVIGRGLDRN
jgi:hypothetical protein